VETVDLAGSLVLPSFVNPHAHLDKAMLAREIPNKSGTLDEARQRMRNAKRTLTSDSIQNRCRSLLAHLARLGVTAARTHVDVDDLIGLRGIEAMLELREEFRDSIELQIVAFPQEGMWSDNDAQRLVDEALGLGADVVGGHLSIAKDFGAIQSEIDQVFRLALKHDRDIDVHVDLDLDLRPGDADEPSRLGVWHLIQRTTSEGYAGRVTASHVAALGELSPAARQRVIEAMAEAGVAVIVLPATALYVQGRSDVLRVRRGVAPLRELISGGVRVAIGTDNIRDPFNPFSGPDPLQHASIAALASHMIGAVDYRAVLRLMTIDAAAVMRLPAHDLSPGSPGDLVIFDTGALDGLLDGPVSRTAVRRGSLPRLAGSGSWERLP
jgi:cytosine deaminase